MKLSEPFGKNFGNYFVAIITQRNKGLQFANYFVAIITKRNKGLQFANPFKTLFLG